MIAYDARGHGASDPAPRPTPTTTPTSPATSLRVLDERGIERAVLAGASMGAHTRAALRARRTPSASPGWSSITPAYDPDADGRGGLARWDALSDGLRTGGVEGFVEAYGEPHVPERGATRVLTVLRQRLRRHEHPEAVADALRAVPRSRAVRRARRARARSTAPTVVVADRDEADPGHPLAVGERYAARDPGRAAGRRGAGASADRLAGRAALEGHRRAWRRRRRR